jgi:hypothetical protein
MSLGLALFFRKDMLLLVTGEKLLHSLSCACDPYYRSAAVHHYACFGAGYVEFIKVDKEVIDIATEMDTRERDEMDLFVAAMFELLAGKNQVMEQYFLP